MDCFNWGLGLIFQLWSNFAVSRGLDIVYAFRQQSPCADDCLSSGITIYNPDVLVGRDGDCTLRQSARVESLIHSYKVEVCKDMITIAACVNVTQPPIQVPNGDTYNGLRPVLKFFNFMRALFSLSVDRVERPCSEKPHTGEKEMTSLIVPRYPTPQHRFRFASYPLHLSLNF